jgi:hypothetical protein
MFYPHREGEVPMRTDPDDCAETAPAIERADDWTLTVDGLTVRRALDEVGLRAPARFYPEWACAEAFLLVLLRCGGRLPAATVHRRANEVGLRRETIQRARVRLGVITTKQRGIREGGWLWSLPADLEVERGTPIVQRRWQRWRDLL